jgi:UrcA family protein
VEHAFRRSPNAFRQARESFVGRGTIAVELRMIGIAARLFCPSVTGRQAHSGGPWRNGKKRRFSDMNYTAILAAALAVAAAAPAVAATQVSTSTAVRYTDLDLSTADGQAQLDRRIDVAARAACGLDTVRTDTRMPSQPARRCYDEARSNVNRQVAELIARDKSRG